MHFREALVVPSAARDHFGRDRAHPSARAPHNTFPAEVSSTRRGLRHPRQDPKLSRFRPAVGIGRETPRTISDKDIPIAPDHARIAAVESLIGLAQSQIAAGLSRAANETDKTNQRPLQSKAIRLVIALGVLALTILYTTLQIVL
jgi:hypothetical protein